MPLCVDQCVRRDEQNLTGLHRGFSTNSVAFPVKAGDHLGMRNGLGMQPLEQLFKTPDSVVSSILVQVLRLELISSEV